jgi:hypothetical protein
MGQIVTEIDLVVIEMISDQNQNETVIRIVRVSDRTEITGSRIT